MKAGRKDRRVEIQQLSVTRGTAGSATQTWSLYKQVWAEVTPTDGAERFSADQFTSERMSDFKIDYIPAFSPKTYRLKYEGKVYDILSVIEIGRREALKLTARAQGV